MINNEEKYLRYLLNQMSEDEKHLFENELESSKQIRDDYESYKKVMDLVIGSKNITLNSQYAQTIIPKFRKKLEGKKKQSIIVKYGYAFSALFIAALSYLVITQTLTDKQNSQKMYSDLTKDEASFFASEMNIELGKDYDEITIQKIDSVYNDKLSNDVTEAVNDNSIDVITEDMNLNELNQYLSDKDVDLIFAELSNKEKFKR